MPFPIAAAIAGGASLLGTGLNAASTGNMNKKNRQFSERMYNQQRDDSIKFWEMQNSYNTPQQQMQRFAEAGMNPALAYGNGTPGNASSAPDVPTAIPLNHKAPDLNIGQAFDTYFNVQTQAQRLSNEKQMGNNLAIDALIKTQDQEAKMMANNYMKDFGYKYKRLTDRDSSNLIYERYLGENAKNTFNFGGEKAGKGEIVPGSAYSLQQMGLKIMNDLRNTAIQGNKQRTRLTKQQADYEERFKNGDIKDMTGKDWLNFGRQLIKPR